MRGQWFIDGSWLPLEEEESDLIEQEHLNHFRGQQMQDTFETDLVVRTVDSKDGERMGRAWGENSKSRKLQTIRSSNQRNTGGSVLITKSVSRDWIRSEEPIFSKVSSR